MLIAVALGLPACGGDDEPDAPSDATAPEKTVATDGERTATEKKPPKTGTDEGPAPDKTSTDETSTDTGGATAPEDEEGGAGDEEPARNDVVFSARGSRLTPTLANVPPYVAVRVVLQSADRGRHRVEVAGRTLRVGPGSLTASVVLEGLRPQRAYNLRGDAGASARIVALSEPGG